MYARMHAHQLGFFIYCRTFLGQRDKKKVLHAATAVLVFSVSGRRLGEESVISQSPLSVDLGSHGYMGRLFGLASEWRMLGRVCVRELCDHHVPAQHTQKYFSCHVNLLKYATRPGSLH
eukprot:scpid21887/ scgid18603/ 